MSRVKFISVDYLKRFTDIEDNVDDDKLVPFIYEAQDIHIQGALGSTFYDRLKQGVIDNDLNADETKLLTDFIQPCVNWWALYYIIPHLNFKLTNKAVSSESSEYSVSADLAQTRFLRDDVKNFAEFRLRRLNKYMCDFNELFPEYNNPGNDENMHKNTNDYNTGIYMPRRGRPRVWSKYHDKWI